MYIWQKTQWQHLMQQSVNLPHAMLFRGQAGTGKFEFAMHLSNALLCQSLTELKQACGSCPSCTWFKEGHHPDFRLISPEDADDNDDAAINLSKKKTTKKSQISVAQIRQLNNFLSLSSHQVNSLRFILIAPADTLNIASANALLKMLEEPPANTLFILVTSQPQRLLATILSRCQIVDMPLPNSQDALSWLTEQGINNAKTWLDYAGGAPLLAQQFFEEGNASEQLIKHLILGAKLDAFTCAPLLLALGIERAIDALQKWIFDITLYASSQRIHYHTQHRSALQALCKSVNLKLVLNFQQKLVEAKKTANHPLSNEMQLENILLQYSYIFKPISLKPS